MSYSQPFLEHKNISVIRGKQATPEPQNQASRHPEEITRSALLPERLIASNGPKQDTARIHNKAVKSLAESRPRISATWWKTTPCALGRLMLHKTASASGATQATMIAESPLSAILRTAKACPRLEQLDSTSFGIAPTAYRPSPALASGHRRRRRSGAQKNSEFPLHEYT